MNPVTASEMGRISLFDGLPEDELAGLAAVTIRKRLDDGDTLFEQGQPAATLHVVMSGGLVLRADANRRSVIVDTSPGRCRRLVGDAGGAITLSTARAVGRDGSARHPGRSDRRPGLGWLEALGGPAATHHRPGRRSPRGELQAVLQVGSEGVISAG